MAQQQQEWISSGVLVAPAEPGGYWTSVTDDPATHDEADEPVVVVVPPPTSDT